jgi:hypothetical protein
MSAQSPLTLPSPRGGEGSPHRGASLRAVVLLALLLLPLGACGKKGPLEPPADEPNTYPKVYPRE